MTQWERTYMQVGEYLPFWSQLTPRQQQELSESSSFRHYAKGAVLHRGSDDCVGLIIVASGQLRVYTTSEEGKEITLYRLLKRDLCLFSASCAFQNIQFEVSVSAESDSGVYHIPAAVYQRFTKESLAVANYTNDLMASRFSDVMWLLDQILSKRLDGRLAAFLLEESEAVGSHELHLTHEQIARHLGTMREVVTRMLRYFQSEGWIKLSRGSIVLLQEEPLRITAQGSLR